MNREQLQALYENSDWCLEVTMPDGSKWTVPVMHIANNRAAYYAPNEFDGDLEKSLFEDTLPAFQQDPNEITDWAANNMDWEEVAGYARQVATPTKVNYQAGWTNGPKRIVGC